MAHTITIKRWNPETASPTSQYVVLPDDTANDPYHIKKVYGARITIKTSASATLDNIVTYATDGSDSFVSTYISSTVINSSSDYQVIDVDFSTPVECQSIRLKVAFDNQAVYINDISRELRTIHRRVT